MMGVFLTMPNFTSFYCNLIFSSSDCFSSYIASLRTFFYLFSLFIYISYSLYHYMFLLLLCISLNGQTIAINLVIIIHIVITIFTIIFFFFLFAVLTESYKESKKCKSMYLLWVFPTHTDTATFSSHWNESGSPLVKAPAFACKRHDFVFPMFIYSFLQYYLIGPVFIDLPYIYFFSYN